MENAEQFMSLLLPILIILVIGIVVLSGWLVWVFTRRRDQGAEATGLGSAAPTALSNAPLYLLSVKRGEADTWDIFVQGIRYPNLAAVPDPQIRTDVRLAVRQATAFVGKTMTPTTSEVAAPLPAAGPSPQRTRTIPAPVNAVASPTRRSATPGGLVPVIDLAHEITEIIEELQAKSPALQAHAVSLQNVPSGGVSFLVDGHIYADIADIPYPEVQGLIRQATREWERR